MSKIKGTLNTNMTWYIMYNLLCITCPQTQHWKRPYKHTNVVQENFKIIVKNFQRKDTWIMSMNRFLYLCFRKFEIVYACLNCIATMVTNLKFYWFYLLHRFYFISFEDSHWKIQPKYQLMKTFLDISFYL